MTTRDTPPRGRSRALQTAHLLLAALAAVVIAVASQGWPPSDGPCETGTTCDAG